MRNIHYATSGVKHIFNRVSLEKNSGTKYNSSQKFRALMLRSISS